MSSTLANEIEQTRREVEFWQEFADRWVAKHKKPLEGRALEAMERAKTRYARALEKAAGESGVASKVVRH
jgi:hypothetical protein